MLEHEFYLALSNLRSVWIESVGLTAKKGEFIAW